jgi:hypothetical protein
LVVEELLVLTLVLHQVVMVQIQSFQQSHLLVVAEEDKVVLLVNQEVQEVVEEDKVVLEVVHYNQVVLVILLP